MSYVYFFLNPTSCYTDANVHNVKKSANYVMHHNIMKTNVAMQIKEIDLKAKMYDNFEKHKEKKHGRSSKQNSPQSRQNGGVNSNSPKSPKSINHTDSKLKKSQRSPNQSQNTMDKRIYNLIEWLRSHDINLNIYEKRFLDNDDFLNSCINGTVFAKLINRLEGVYLLN